MKYSVFSRSILSKLDRIVSRPNWLMTWTLEKFFFVLGEFNSTSLKYLHCTKESLGFVQIKASESGPREDLKMVHWY